MAMTVTRLPDGGVWYESGKATVTIYENKKHVRDGKLTEEGLAAIKTPIARMFAQKVRSA